MAVATRPRISVSVATPLGYLADNEVDVSAVVNRTKTAVMLYVNDLGLGAPLTVAGVNAAAAAVNGIERVLPRTTLNGDVVDLPAVDGGYMVDTANEVLLEIFVLEN